MKSQIDLLRFPFFFFFLYFVTFLFGLTFVAKELGITLKDVKISMSVSTSSLVSALADLIIKDCDNPICETIELLSGLLFFFQIFFLFAILLSGKNSHFIFQVQLMRL